MKRFVALLLTLIMVFTILPPMIGPPALAVGDCEICGLNCPADCPAHNAGGEILVHQDVNGTHCVAVKSGNIIKLFNYDSAGNLVTNTLAEDDIDTDRYYPEHPAPPYYGNIVLITYTEYIKNTDNTESTTSYTKGYITYDGITVYLGSRIDKEVMRDDCQKWITKRAYEKDGLRIFMEYTYGQMSWCSKPENAGQVYTEHEDHRGLDPLTPIVALSSISDPTAYVYRKIQMNGDGLPRIEFSGIGKSIGVFESGAELFLFIRNATVDLPGALLDAVTDTALGMANAQEKGEYTVYYDYCISYQKIDLITGVYAMSAPRLTGDDEHSVFRYVGDDIYDATDWQWLYGGELTINDTWYVQQEFREIHQHTFNPGQYNALCSMICPDCGYGRRPWPGNGHTDCWRHVKNTATGQWEHQWYDLDCGIPILDWEDTSFLIYHIDTEQCDCLEDPARFDADPNHVYSDCTDTTCECGHVRDVGNHYVTDCSDLHCAFCGGDQVPQDHQYEWRLIYDGFGNLTNQHEKRCTICFDIIPGSFGDHDYDIWKPVDSDFDGDKDDYEARTCLTCNLSTETRPHNLVGDIYLSQWSMLPTSAEEICNFGGYYKNRCLNNCGYTDPFEKWVDAGHIDTNKNCICDRCDTALDHTYPPEWSLYASLQHRRACTTCGNYEYQDHSFSSWTPYTTSLHQKTCSVCGFMTTASHAYDGCIDTYCEDCGENRDPVSGTANADGHIYNDCSDNNCNRTECNYDRGMVIGYLNSDGHVYWECEDTDCNRIGCGHTRGVIHSYPSTWSLYASDQHRRACTECGHYQYQDHSFSSWTPYTTSLHQKTCTKCGFMTTASHSYDGCLDTYCEDCGENRDPVSGTANADGHIYNDCLDQHCNRTECNYDRGMVLGTLYGDDHVYLNCGDTTCNRIGCGHTRLPVAHTYTDCSDRDCIMCSADRGTTSGYLQGGHMYSNYCTATTCTRTGCGYVRTKPGHYYGSSSYPYKISTASVCHEERKDCTRTACSYVLLVSTDKVHSYSSCYDLTCGDCNYSRPSAVHSLSSWTYYTAGLHCKTCTKSGCGFMTTASHNWVNVTAALFRCSGCGATKYGS